MAEEGRQTGVGQAARITRRSVLGLALRVQGLYYVVTGLWAIVSLDSFSRVTGHAGDPFEMHSIAALALVLGVFLVWSASKEPLQRPAGFLTLGVVLAVMVPELIYLPRVGNPPLFWVDFVEEGLVGLVIAACLARRSRR